MARNILKLLSSLILLSCTAESIEFAGFNQFEVRRLLSGDSVKSWRAVEVQGPDCWLNSRFTFEDGDSLRVLKSSLCDGDSSRSLRGGFYLPAAFNDPVESIVLLFSPDSLVTGNDTILGFRDSITYQLLYLYPEETEWQLSDAPQGSYPTFVRLEYLP